MISSYAWMLGCFVEIEYPTDNQSSPATELLIKGRIAKADDKLTIICAPSPPEFCLEGNEVAVKVYADDRIILAFNAIVLKHFPHPEEKNETLIIKQQGELLMQEGRSARRVAMNIPGTIQLVTLKGRPLPLEVRRKTIKITITDISESGVQITCKTRLPQYLEALITIYPQQKENLTLKGELVWSKALAEGSSYGFHFTQLDLYTKGVLRDIVMGNL